MTARLTDASGRAIEIAFDGYRLEGADNDYDANWLVVRVALTEGDDRWEGRAPALLTWEVAELVAWLREVAAVDSGARIFAGLEPALQFEAFRDGALSITVILSGGLSPFGADPQAEHPQTFEPTPGDVAAFADALAALAAVTPVRAVEEDGYARRLIGGETA